MTRFESMGVSLPIYVLKTFSDLVKNRKKVPKRYLRKLMTLANLDQNNPLRVVGKFGEKSLKFGENNLKRLLRF